MLSAPAAPTWAAPATATPRQPLGRLVPLLGVVGCVVVAYHHSLLTLLTNLDDDTPLAYLALVPAISLLLAYVVSRSAEAHDRHVDYLLAAALLAGSIVFLVVPVLVAVIALAHRGLHRSFGPTSESRLSTIVGLTLLAAAAAIVLILPVRLSSLFWTWRIDLLSLPLFVAGAVTCGFGLPTAWRHRIPITFLFLAWPLPFVTALGVWLDRVEALTLAGVRAALHVLPVAHAVGGGDRSLFRVGPGADGFVVSVGSACAGANTMVGFGLVAVAIVAVARGRLAAKVLWLAAGAVLFWALNVMRIVLVFGAGRAWGEGAALRGLHPVLGLALFAAGVVCMLRLLAPLGLRPPTLRSPPRPSQPTTGRPSGLRSGVVVVAVAVATAVVGVADHGFREYELLAGDLGVPRVEGFSQAPPTMPGWRMLGTSSVDWGQRFFGPDSTWLRYLYGPEPSPDGTPAPADARVFVDVVLADSLRPFSTYGVESCYRLHDYTIEDRRSAELPGGVTADVVGYVAPRQARWTSLSWHWPVVVDGRLRYERVTLLHVDSPDPGANPEPARPGLVRGFLLELRDAVRGQSSGGSGAHSEATRSLLLGFASASVLAHAGGAE